jgi:alpha-2-macroglobulin
MLERAFSGVSALAFFFLAAAFTVPSASLAAGRTIVTTQDGDYFGFDLRSVQNVTLDQCEATCLADKTCRAFTYNTKAKWCFLKTDYGHLNPFAGAVAGKVVATSGEADIGAPPALAFLPDYMRDEAQKARARVSGPVASTGDGLASLTSRADAAMAAGEARGAADAARQALAITPDDPALWLTLARATVATKPADDAETASLQEQGTSAAFNAYQLSRTAHVRAAALDALAKALEKRSLFRPALEAYKASLALVASPAVQAAYADLKARKGFRVVDHSVDADTLSPRVCVQFSEALVKSGVDYGPFVTVDDQAAKAIEAKDKQICVEGLDHGARYRVALRAGLPSAVGEVLESPVLLNVYVRDRAPSAHFTGDNFVLPSTARRGIPVVTVNTDQVKVALYRVGDRALAQLLSGSQFLSQLDAYSLSTVENDLGAPVWKGTLDVASDLNKDVVTSFPVDEALPERKPGVYVLTAVPASARDDDGSTRATQWFVVSDIGLSTYAGDDGLNVFARSLASARPMAGVDVKLVARNNEVLGTAKTDADGHARFAPGLMRGAAGMAPEAITAANGQSDYVFLDLTRAGFDLSDRGVTGRPAPGAVDVLAWTERGIYRAGETVHVAALARDHAANAVASLPLTFIFRRPDGVETRRMVDDGAALGGYAVDLALPENAMRGTWTASVYADPKADAVAEKRFLVEDFVPDRTALDLSSKVDEIRIGAPATIDVAGRFLYGAPAAGLSLEGEVNIATTREWDKFPGYLFGLADEDNEEAQKITLDDLPVLDDQGKASFDVMVKDVPETTRFLTAEVVVRMREGSGRAVEKSLDLDVADTGPMIGVKPEFGGDSVPENSTARFKVIALAPDGGRTAMAGLKWSLVKIERNYQWYHTDSGWNYEPVDYTKKVADGRIDAAAGGEPEIALPVDWGRYRLQVETDDPSGPATSIEFDAGWFVSSKSTDTPDGLEVALDKPAYAPGDVAHLKVSPRFAGELLVTIGADELLATQTAEVPAGGATIDIPVKAGWGAGAYVTATLFRPGDAQANHLPMRAIGVKWLTIDPGAHKLGVQLSPTSKMEPRRPLDIPVAVTGLAAGETAYVTVAAVDVGILNLTDYQTPDPDGWYFGQRQLGLELRDLYGRLIDGSLGSSGRIRTGGDMPQMASHGSPPTQKLVAFFSGPVKVDAEGKAHVSFDIPQFNGTVRVMAVAWSKAGVGHASTDVIVRDPVVVAASAPKFMAPGDHAQLRLDVANTDGPAGDYALDVAATGGVTVDRVPATVTLAAGGKAALTIPLTAGGAADGTVAVRLSLAGGPSVGQSVVIPVRPAVMPVTSRMKVALAANGGSLKLDGDLLAGSLADGASVSVGVSRAAAFDVPGLVMSLDRYPYGCAEQTTSGALPLLYLSEMSAAAGLADDAGVHKRVQDAIYRVLSYQSASGSFGLWGPGSGDLWLDAYVTDFLTRAREQNYLVPADALRQSLENLQNALSYDVNLKEQGTGIAYALYVLARNRKASAGDLRYYADTQIGAFATPLARAQIAASLGLYGDAERADRAFRSAYDLARSLPVTKASSMRADYGSPLRDDAAMLALAAETRPVPSLLPQMVALAEAAGSTRTSASTQEQAWMLLAARAIKESGTGLSLEVDGIPYTGNFARRFTGEELTGAPLTIANKGSEPVTALVTTIAAPKEPLPAGGDGFEIDKSYYRLDGTQTDVAEVKQNERFVVVIKARALNDWPSRVLVTDLLPAGFEIDNPHIVGSADLANFDWLPEQGPAHAEFRNDRFVAAFDRNAGDGGEMTAAYVVRAVTPGVYALPAATVEDMYRPQYSARTASGRMEVQAAAR